ncbi:MAG TPA: ROK family protein [Jatrophihabitantaceae bacterium]|nr:ROK family protein [Jatrophihabitantaceae bacterium]
MSVIAIDVGGTTIKGARVSQSGLDERAAVATPASDVVDAIVSVARSLMSADVDAVAVVVPGAVDEGVVRHAVNVRLHDVDLRAALEDELGLPAVVGHDVAAAGEAEAALAGTDLLFVAIGTGIAGINVVDGRAHRGTSGRAGEIGHLVVVPDGEPCACGNRGCVEAYASAASIARRYGDGPAEVVASRLGIDARADVVWHEAIGALAAGIAAAVTVLDPPVVLIGGGLAAAGDALLVPLRDRLADAFAWRSSPPVHLGRLGVDAGIHGAARLARTAIRVKERSA